MRINQFVTDDDAVSPVIGIILMVAITVILATVIGTFVLGVGQSAPDEAPQATWRFDLSPVNDGFSAASGDEVEITHVSGDSIKQNTGVQVGGTRVSNSSTDVSFVGGGFSFPIGAGQSVTVREDGSNAMAPGDFVLVIYRPDKPEIRSIIGERELPS